MNARYTDYVSIFFVDIVLIAVFMFVLLVLRQGELQILVKLGVYKNVEDLTDKEIISEYNKLKKQSNKLQNRLRQSEGDVHVARKKIRMVSGATNRSSKQETDSGNNKDPTTEGSDANDDFKLRKKGSS
jgi:hypothetical protein